MTREDVRAMLTEAGNALDAGCYDAARDNLLAALKRLDKLAAASDTPPKRRHGDQ